MITALSILTPYLALPLWTAAQAPPRPVQATFGTTVGQPGDFRGEVYFLPPGHRGLPDFAKLKPAGTIYTPEFNVPDQDFSAGFPGISKRFEWFAIDFRTEFWIRRPGEYTFELTSDDGSCLYIDDQKVIDNDGQHAAITRRGKVRLEAGSHRIRVSYYQGPRFRVALRLRVAAPGEELRLFHTDDFSAPSTAVPARP